jgi:lactam utilization protein B
MFIDSHFFSNAKLVNSGVNDVNLQQATFTKVDAGETAKQAIRVVKEGKARSITGRDIPMRADCICVHSDTPGSVELARVVRRELAPYLG